MKIAIVSQPLDTVMPPYQNSVGACTYGVALPLSESAEVLIYALQDDREGSAALPAERNINFRFFAATRLDRFLFSIQKKAAKLFHRSSPISTSKWLFPSYGRMVARDLKKQRCDVIHLQHCSQYAPIIRAANPDARIVLHLHAEWFSQSDRTVLTNRLASVDLITTVGNYITKKTKRISPSSPTAVRPFITESTVRNSRERWIMKPAEDARSSAFSTRAQSLHTKGCMCYSALL